jgi:hypothetical protein
MACAVIALALAQPAAAQSQLTTRVNVSSAGAQANNTSFFPRISDDARYIVFSSYASTLVANDTNIKSDIFVRDRQTATTTRVSVDSNGVQSNGDSYLPAISADGRFVAFESIGSNLVPGDTNGVLDIFVRDNTTGQLTRVSVDSSGTQSNGHSYVAAISADGRFVAFSSDASNLVAGDTNGVMDVFVHDNITGETRRVSVDSSGIQGNGASVNPSLSGDGRYVAFQSAATNLVAGDTNGVVDVFVHDNSTGLTTRVSLDSSGVQGDGESVYPWISESGRKLTFTSAADNFVAGDTNQTYDVFLRDLVSGQTTLVSVGTSGQSASAMSTNSSISADERWVAFQSDATDIVADDVNPFTDVYVRDVLSGVTLKANVSTDGVQGNLFSYSPVVSGDGRFVAFYSGSNNLVLNDTNSATDVFLRDQFGTGVSSSCEPGVAGVLACPCSNAPSGSGRGCNNSSATGGASLAAAGLAYLSMDGVVFTTSGEKPTATSIVLQGNAQSASGIVFGQGVRCVAGTLKRLYTKTASGGSITAPTAGDPTVSSRSSALGDVISAGQSRWYLVYYRDPIVLGGCPASSTFNATQTLRIAWSL